MSLNDLMLILLGFALGYYAVKHFRVAGSVA